MTVQFFNALLMLYIDPATSSYIIQIIAGAVISLGVLFGIFRTRVILFFRDLRVKILEKRIAKEAAKTDTEREDE